jgi:hypothetical protein
VLEKICFCTTKLWPYSDTVLCGCITLGGSNMSLCAVWRMVLGHLVLKYSLEVVYYTTLQDIPSSPECSRRCQIYWVTHRRLPTTIVVPNKIAVIAGHELQALEEIVPSEIMRLGAVTTGVTASRQITYVNSLLHLNRASLSREQHSHWRLIIFTVLCASTLLGFLCFSLWFRLRTIKLNCCIWNNSPTPDTTD